MAKKSKKKVAKNKDELKKDEQVKLDMSFDEAISLALKTTKKPAKKP